ncbi:ABC transporter ATP-binding protein [Konateibacter massiliensis]|uniref:ABC transporter ATP-binding protein n=1 Tax=Konateibacter massiliensis TaxID=2002841 RepID=UPI000C14488A|nr:ATP-binding cassette domain-containing protein [Konateibacter massiliensis]
MIEVSNLSKEFKTAKKYPGFKGTVKSLFSNETVIKKAVSDVSFSIEEGEMVGYIGSNGAGKSTTIKMMTGILVPTAGKCIVNGIEPYKNRTQNAKQVGVVFGQRTQLWWDLPLTETFTVLKEIYQVTEEDFKKRMEFLNDVLGIHEFENNAVRTLSLGQRMRADLGAALIHNPRVLYLDEPTIGLDVVVKDKIRDAIKEMNRNFKTTVILTTHDLVDIEELCKHIIIIDEGRKIYDGSLENLKVNYGAKTTLELDLAESEKIKEIDLNEAFSLGKESLSAEVSDNTLNISFVKDKISVSKLAGYVMNLCEVSDMRIKETDITSIVKKIYMNGGN